MTIIYTFPTWLLVAAVIVPTVAAAIGGRWLGRRQADAEDERAHSLNNGLRGSILGLVALLLGFTYAMTSSRYSDRQKVVLDEANALGTCYLRAGLLSDASKERIRKDLRTYTDTRIELFDKGADLSVRKPLNDRLDATLNSLWAAIEASAKAEPDLTRNSFIVQAANDMIDLNTTRRWAVRNKVPPAILMLLAVCVVISGAVSAHALAQRRGAAWVLWGVQLVLTTCVLYVTLDLDRPVRGLIEIDHQPLIETRKGM